MNSGETFFKGLPFILEQKLKYPSGFHHLKKTLKTSWPWPSQCFPRASSSHSQWFHEFFVLYIPKVSQFFANFWGKNQKKRKKEAAFACLYKKGCKTCPWPTNKRIQRLEIAKTAALWPFFVSKACIKKNFCTIVDTYV